MLKLYKLNGATFQFEEGNQPPEAVEVECNRSAKRHAARAGRKRPLPFKRLAKAPANKARTGSRSK